MDNETWGGGGRELVKEVTYIYVFVIILSKPILLCSLACWFTFFVKLLYYTA